MSSDTTTPPQILTANGLIPPPVDPTTGLRTRCVSFNESACTGGGPDVDSCTNNPTGIAPN